MRFFFWTPQEKLRIDAGSCSLPEWVESGRLGGELPEGSVANFEDDSARQQARNELSLAVGIALSQPSHSSFVDHVHRLDSLKCTPNAGKRAVCFGQPETFLHRAVVLLHDVVQVSELPEPNPTRQKPFGIQFLHGGWIRRVLVHVHHSGGRIPRRLQGLPKEPLGTCGIAFCGEQEIGRLARCIHRALEKPALAFHLDIGFVHAIALVGGFQVRAATLVELRRIGLHLGQNTTRRSS
jgi:hypothetical protein